MKLRVYRNLTSRCWSAQQYKKGVGWRLWRHFDELYLTNPGTKVYASGRERVQAEKRKNVHAYVTGEFMPVYYYTSHVTWRQVSYDPYKAGYFTFADTGRRVDGEAQYAHFGADGRVYFGKGVAK